MLGMIFTIFDLEVALIFSTKFRVHSPFGTEEKRVYKIAAVAAILDTNIFAIFNLQV